MKNSKTVLDCSETPSHNLNAIICKAKHIKGPKMIRLRFPIDEKKPEDEEFDHCVSDDFIDGFNEDGIGLHQTLKEFTLYGTLFDLAELEKHTNETMTEKVYVIADIVYMSKKMVGLLTYDLNIRARKVYINYPIKSEISFESFKSKQENYVVYSKQLSFDNGGQNFLMRHRKYGRVDILDSSINPLEESCSPKIDPYKVICPNISQATFIPLPCNYLGESALL